MGFEKYILFYNKTVYNPNYSALFRNIALMTITGTIDLEPCTSHWNSSEVTWHGEHYDSCPISDVIYGLLLFHKFTKYGYRMQKYKIIFTDRETE